MADQSSVGNHLAELYNSIHVAQQRVEAAKAKVKEEEDALDKVKSDFTDYLKQAGVYSLIAPTPVQQGNLSSDGGATGTTKERKPRTSSADRLAGAERNREIYVSQYPNGLDEKTGLPKKFKGRGSKNDEIDAMMKDDEREYEAKHQQGSGDDIGADTAEYVANDSQDDVDAVGSTSAKTTKSTKTSKK